MIVWGLTGNIATGKSTVEGMLAEAGIPVIDADLVAREIVEPGEPALEAIKACFGAEVFGPDEKLDRAALGARVFSDAKARKQLEAITHPRIFQRIVQKLAELDEAGAELAVVSAALMVESGSYRNYAGLAVVTCSQALQLERLLSRDDLDRDAALARISSQLPQEAKEAVADVVIDNSGDRRATQTQVRGWLEALQADSTGPG